MFSTIREKRVAFLFFLVVLGTIIFLTSHAHAWEFSCNSLFSKPRTTTQVFRPQSLFPKSSRVLKISGGYSFANIASDEALDPSATKSFVVSFLVRYRELPPERYRQKVVAKYMKDKHPYGGWAIALHRRETSLRPEVFWRDTHGRGGWFTFDDLEVVANQWYAFTVVARPLGFLSMFVESMGEQEETPVFLGGHDISQVRVPKTSSALQIGSFRAGEGSFRGDVSQVFIGELGESFQNFHELTHLFAGGPQSILDKVETAEVGFWLSTMGKDESAFARDIRLRGDASWQELF